MADKQETVDLWGEKFAIASEIAEVHFMEFAELSADGADTGMMETLAGLWRFAKQAVAKDDVKDADGKIVAFGVKRFVQLARKNNASSDDLMKIVNFVFTGQTSLPTGASADSSDGRTDTPTSSVPSAADKASAAFPGRPDLAVAALRAVS